MGGLEFFAGIDASQKGAASGVASLGSDGVVKRAQLAKPGIILPPDWGQFWIPKRDAAGSAKATVAVVGDSIGRGYYSSNLNTKGWAALLKASLQTTYGDGGSGFQGVGDTAFVMNSLFVAAAAQTAYASQEVGLTGTWTLYSGTVGPGGVNLNSTVAGSTLTFTVRGSSVSVYYLTNSSQGTFTWTIDGVAQTAVNTTGALGYAKVTVSGLSTGSHTVVITAPGTNNIGITGVSGEKSAGVILNNFARFGTTAAAFNNTDTIGGVMNWSGGPNYPADLLIYALGLNDANAGTAPDTWERDAARSLTAVRAVASPQTDILIVLNHVGTYDNATPVYQSYAERARGLAATYGAALVDLWRLGRNSWAYWNALGYWSGTDGSGASGSNNVHLSDAGHQYLADQLSPILTLAA